MTDVFVDALSKRQIEGFALAWREALGVDSCWAPDLVEILERKLPALWPDFSLVAKKDSEMEGIEGFTSFKPPMIVLPDAGYRDLVLGRHRVRWTAAHELGHLFLHEATTKHRDVEPVQNKIIDKAYNSAEWQANRFASEFLMPEYVVSEFGSPEDISRNCNVSLQAATLRYGEVRLESQRSLPDVVRAYLDPKK